MLTWELLAQFDVARVGVAGLMVLAIAFVFVLILNIANAKLKVEQDPTVAAVEAVLPGVNCGGCGLAGCGAYAAAVVADNGLMGKCGPGGEELVTAIAGILGVHAGTAAPVRPVVHCAACRSDQTNRADYYGINSCGEGNIVSGVIGCPFGCMGYGDCEQACDFDAIHIIDGRAVVDYERCVGCGACATACPRGLIEMMPLHEDPLLVVACASQDKAKDVRGYCKVGCVGCTLCVKQAPDMFHMSNNLAVIDYEQYGDQEQRDKATEKCPRALLVYVGKNAPAESKGAQPASAQSVAV